MPIEKAQQLNVRSDYTRNYTRKASPKAYDQSLKSTPSHKSITHARKVGAWRSHVRAHVHFLSVEVYN